MKYWSPLIALCASLTLVQAENWQPDEGFTSLFNGKDLTGWSFRQKMPRKSNAIAPVQKDFSGLTASPAHGKDKAGRYSAANGILSVNPPVGRERLISKIDTTAEFSSNFILKLEFRAGVNADSGIFLRKPQLQCRDYWVAGPYNDLKGYKPQEWNQIVVTVKDNIAHCTCNGVVLEEALQLPPSGPIGLEGDRGLMEYRHIQIKRLD